MRIDRTGPHRKYDVIDDALKRPRSRQRLFIEPNALKALEAGRIVLRGSGRELLRNPAARAAYLGARRQAEVILEEESHAH